MAHGLSTMFFDTIRSTASQEASALTFPLCPAYKTRGHCWSFAISTSEVVAQTVATPQVLEDLAFFSRVFALFEEADLAHSSAAQ